MLQGVGEGELREDSWFDLGIYDYMWDKNTRQLTPFFDDYRMWYWKEEKNKEDNSLVTSLLEQMARDTSINIFPEGKNIYYGFAEASKDSPDFMQKNPEIFNENLIIYVDEKHSNFSKNQYETSDNIDLTGRYISEKDPRRYEKLKKLEEYEDFFKDKDYVLIGFPSLLYSQVVFQVARNEKEALTRFLNLGELSYSYNEPTLSSMDNVIIFVSGYIPDEDMALHASDFLKTLFSGNESTEDRPGEKDYKDPYVYLAKKGPSGNALLATLWELAKENYEEKDHFRSNIVRTSDVLNYWKSFDDSFIARRHKELEKENTLHLYADGNFSSVTRMKNSGFDFRKNGGKEAARDFKQKYGKLPKRVKIDIVSHSMGYAYALGFAEELQDEYDLGAFYTFAPENPTATQSIPSGIDEFWQYGSGEEDEPWYYKDQIAPQKPIPGMDKLKIKSGQIPIPEDIYKGFTETFEFKTMDHNKSVGLQGAFYKTEKVTLPTCSYECHFIRNFDWVFKEALIPKGGKGYIKSVSNEK